MATTTVRLIHGDNLDVLPTIADASIDAAIMDPPYPHIKRKYGTWTEAEWWDLMMGVVRETRRVLKPTGSAVFILQPNSEHIGVMRGWLWRFMVWIVDNWNLIQDVYWWNIAALPVGGAITDGLLRGSVKNCIWAGPADCWRNQNAVLWAESESNVTFRARGRFERRTFPSGRVVDGAAARNASLTRGGVTPFNVLPVPQSGFIRDAAGNYGHGAGTPLAVAEWWVRYIVPPGGVVLDPFCGAGTMGVAAVRNGCSFIGIERMDGPEYLPAARERIDAALPVQPDPPVDPAGDVQLSLFDPVGQAGATGPAEG